MSPFYPEPGEFVAALAHTVEAGVASLRPVYDAARRYSPELWRVRASR
jgi:hypothetical protein